MDGAVAMWNCLALAWLLSLLQPSCLPGTVWIQIPPWPWDSSPGELPGSLYTVQSVREATASVTTPFFQNYTWLQGLATKEKILGSLRMAEHCTTPQTPVITMAFGETELKWSELNREKEQPSHNSHLAEQCRMEGKQCKLICFAAKM